MILPFSQKQIESISNSNSRLNLWIGPVRSGKSYSALWRFIQFIINGDVGPLIICGRTDSSIRRNVIRQLQDIVGDDLKYFPGKREAVLWGRTIDLIGANDERSEAKIRGSEYIAALMDEITIIPESFTKMLFSRLSRKNSIFFGTTNPDSPFHWLKKEYIDRKDELNLALFEFKMDDNPSLSEEYKRDLKKEYRGLWYERYIEGKWVLADGAVYDFFDNKFHVINNPPGTALYYIVGIDYGTSNPCVFTLIGYNPSTYPNIWLEKEYYYDSKQTNRQKTDYEYGQDLISFIAGYNIKSIYIDPSALSFKSELRRNGIYDVLDANNDVLSGIRFQSQLISNGTYKICSNCVNSLKEYNTYLWDNKASIRGEDKPIKKNDHCCDAQRYALFTHFFPILSSSSSMTEDDAEKLERMYSNLYTR